MKKLVSALLVLVLALCVVLPSLAEETQAYGGITGEIHWAMAGWPSPTAPAWLRKKWA